MRRQVQGGTPSNQGSDTPKDSTMSAFLFQQNSGQFTNPNISDTDHNYSIVEMAKQATDIALSAKIIAAEASRMASQAIDMAAQASTLAEQVRQRQISIEVSGTNTYQAPSQQSLPGSPNLVLAQTLPAFQASNSPVPGSNLSFPVSIHSHATVKQALPSLTEGRQPEQPLNNTPPLLAPSPPQQQPEQMQAYHMQNYQMQMMLLEEQNKERLLAERAGREAADFIPRTPQQHQPSSGDKHRLQDYQMQLMLLEQQNKKRLQSKAESDVGR